MSSVSTGPSRSSAGYASRRASNSASASASSVDRSTHSAPASVIAAAIAEASAAPDSPAVSTRASSSASALASSPRCFHSSTAARHARSSSSSTDGVSPRRVIRDTADPESGREPNAPTTVRGVSARAGRSRSVISVTTPRVPSDPTNRPVRSSPATPLFVRRPSRVTVPYPPAPDAGAPDPAAPGPASPVPGTAAPLATTRSPST